MQSICKLGCLTGKVNMNEIKTFEMLLEPKQANTVFVSLPLLNPSHSFAWLKGSPPLKSHFGNLQHGDLRQSILFVSIFSFCQRSDGYVNVKMPSQRGDFLVHKGFSEGWIISEQGSERVEA